jgi:hypothetical protein
MSRMSRRVHILLATLFLLPTALTVTGSAIEVQTLTTTVVPQRALKIVPITEYDCRSTGGLVQIDDKCESGQTCIIRTGERVCITSAR